MCMEIPVILNKKAIIAFNQSIEDGEIKNESSLDFALSSAKNTVLWTKALAFVVRAILIDHVFQEGNKRTTAMVMMAEFENHNVNYKPNDVVEIVKKIVLKNIISIEKIKGMIENAIS